jgi:crotonobetainyl-CoA:carnitine CoA-transferase CaiB-like acyl-CoA transferase
LAKIPLLGRFVAGGPLRKAVGAAIARRDLDHWLAVVDRERLPIAPVLTVDEALHDPQLLGRRLGADRHVHAPWPLSGPVEGKAPRLGEHNDEILAD